MKLTINMVLIVVLTGAAAAQNPASILQNTKKNLNAAEQKKVQQENAALGASQSAGKPAAGSAARAPQPLPTAAKPAAPSPKPLPAAAKPAVAAPKSEVLVSVTPASPASGKKAEAHKSPFVAPKKAAPTKIAIAPVAPQPPQGSQKVKHVSPKSAAKAEPHAVPAKAEVAKKSGEAAPSDTPKPTKLITAEGRRDPFVSPVVSRSNSPHCSTGKRCLAIDQIMVKGVVKSENGMIAVVVNSLNKAYFLKENDPVYNGYVLKITGDSVVFKETFQDRLGKEATREVVKRITTPAV
jgi:hypothetical protein